MTLNKSQLDHQNDALSYFKMVCSVLEQGTLADKTQLLDQISIVEMKTNWHQNKEYHEHYKVIMTLICQNVFLELIKKNEFNFSLLKICPILECLNFKIANSNVLIDLRQQIENACQQQHDNAGTVFLFHAMLFVLNHFIGEAEIGKQSYLKGIFCLDPQKLFPNDDALRDYSDLFYQNFQNLNLLVDIIATTIFDKNTYFDLPEIQQKNAVIWVLAVIWKIYPSQRVISDRLSDVWFSLFHEAIKRECSELVLFLYFPCYHVFYMFHRSYENQKDFVNQIEMPYSQFCAKLISKFSLNKNIGDVALDQPLKIGFFANRIVFTSPCKLLISLLESLNAYNAEDHQYFLYDVEIIETTHSSPEIVQMIRETGTSYVGAHVMISDLAAGYNYSRIDKALRLRQKIIDDKIDILISSGLNAMTSFLFATRTAKLQLYWTHGFDAFDCVGVDNRITHGPVWIKKSEWHPIQGVHYHCFLPGMKKEFYCPEVDQDQVKHLKNKIGRGQKILGVLCHVHKIANKYYLGAVCEILKRCPDTVFIVCGGGQDKGSEYFEYVQHFFLEQDLKNRVVFAGMVDPHLYGHVIDLLLNTFPVPHGEALMEYASKNRLYVYLHPTLLKLPIEACKEVNESYNTVFKGLFEEIPKIFERKGFNRFKAYSINDYVNLAESIVQEVLTKDSKTYEEFALASNQEQIASIQDGVLNQELASVVFKQCLKAVVDGDHSFTLRTLTE